MFDKLKRGLNRVWRKIRRYKEPEPPPTIEEASSVSYAPYNQSSVVFGKGRYMSKRIYSSSKRRRRGSKRGGSNEERSLS